MRRSLQACLLALVCTVATPAFPGSSNAGAKDVIVDIFAVQSWDSLGAINAPPAQEENPEEPSPPPPSDPVPLPPPFAVVGQWQERNMRMVILERKGETFILCSSACNIRGAVLVDQKITDGYRFKKMNGNALIVAGSDGMLHALDLP